MFELGCHLIDPLVRLMGEPARVTPILQKASADALADNTVAIFEYLRALGIVTCSALHPGGTRRRAFEIFGSNGSAVLRPIEPPTLSIDLQDAAGPALYRRFRSLRPGHSGGPCAARYRRRGDPGPARASFRLPDDLTSLAPAGPSCSP